MPTTPAVAPPTATPDEPPLQPITVAMFRAMVASGIVGEKEPTYLWKGRLARRMAPNRPHSIAVDRARRALDALLPLGLHVQQEQPVAMRTEHSTPEPDLAVLRGLPEDYPDDFPTTADLLLVVEIADSSIVIDRAQADDLAREEVPASWIVDLKKRRVEARDDPDGGRYRRLLFFEEADEIPLILDGGEVGRIAVGALLPPP
jgi:hypothetical protein